jgi:hypothetical protein
MIIKGTDRLPPWKGQLMNRNGRLELIKSTLSAMAIYISICMGLSPCVIKALERILKAFPWAGTDVVQGASSYWPGKKSSGPFSWEDSGSWT